MDIILNGKTISIDGQSRLDDFINSLEINGKFAVELNQTIIPRSEYHKTTISSGDNIEIVEAIGGG